jgi:hypothetical protein
MTENRGQMTEGRGQSTEFGWRERKKVRSREGEKVGGLEERGA